MIDTVRIDAILVDSLGKVGRDQQPVEGSEVINLFMVVVALKPEKVQEHAAEMIELLKEWPSESWGEPVPPLGEKITYLIAGSVLGDQGRAFMLFAFGKLLGWWDILDPHTMHGMEYDDPEGLKMADKGLVSITGYRPTATA